MEVLITLIIIFIPFMALIGGIALIAILISQADKPRESGNVPDKAAVARNLRDREWQSGSEVRAQIKGQMQESRLVSILGSLGGYGYIHNNCYIPRRKGDTTEIDVLWLHESGLYVFESKNFKGWIFGDENSTYWNQTLSNGRGRKARKESFYNPIRQNKGHINALSRYLHYPVDKIYSYIVFGDECEIKTNIRLNTDKYTILYIWQVKNELMKRINSRPSPLAKEQIENFNRLIIPCTNQSEEVKSAHVENIKNKNSKSTNLSLQPVQKEANIAPASNIENIENFRKPEQKQNIKPHIETEEERRKRWEDDWTEAVTGVRPS